MAWTIPLAYCGSTAPKKRSSPTTISWKGSLELYFKQAVGSGDADLFHCKLHQWCCFRHRLPLENLQWSGGVPFIGFFLVKHSLVHAWV